MARELQKLATAAEADPNASPAEVARFKKDMAGFSRLFSRYLDAQAHPQAHRLDWGSIGSSPEGLRLYNDLPPVSTPDEATRLLRKLAVVKLNGGLGTTMGCVGPKSAIEVRNGMTFLDMTVRQIEHLNERYEGANVPLLLMNSFNTDRETRKIVQRYKRHGLIIKCFTQSRYPRIAKESLVPLASGWQDAHEAWYPPGHGDLFAALARSGGLLEELLEQGREWLFVSNIDNLGATVDLAILADCVHSSAGFCMELTERTRADVKGGTLVSPGPGRPPQLLELAQVPPEHRADFQSVKKFKIFNTNNVWINLVALKRRLDLTDTGAESPFDLDVIVNEKTVKVSAQGDSDGEESIRVLQLETAIGAAIRHFDGAHGICVPRSRFLPVKSCSDLFLVQSDLYSLEHGSLKLNPKRAFGTVPLVKLGDSFRRVPSYLERLPSPPHILELEHLSVTGDVTFGRGVALKGTVIIVANHGEHIDIPSGSVLEDKVVSGCLRILDH